MTLPLTLEDIKKILYPIQVSDSPDMLKQYGQDTLSYYVSNASAILFPENADQVQTIMHFAKQHHIKIVPSGGRTGMTGGATAIQGELVVSLEKMNRILSISQTDSIVTCEPGVILQTLHEYVESHALYYPITLAAKGSCQIGGTIATNAGGVHVVKYGNTRQWVAGLKVVTGNGEYLELNTQGLLKNNTGYSLHDLFIGSEGTLGIIVEATLRLTQLPKMPTALLLSHPNLESILACFYETKQEIPLLAFEFFDHTSLTQVLKHQPLQQPFQQGAPFYALIEWESTPDADQIMLRLLERGFDQGWISDGLFSQNEAQRTQFWQYREDISEALRHESPYKYDLSIPISIIPAFYEELMSLFQQQEIIVNSAWFGHIGDGNIHLNLLKPSQLTQDAFYSNCEQLNTQIFSMVRSHGGSISAEHGIGLLKKPYLSFSRSPSEIQFMQQIKNIFDPNHTLNPGKIFDNNIDSPIK